ncbi:hypothetical protein AMTR_s00011p00061680 [Amborella trichopoda]|uniref:Uncharacterized protein n=1 Tax=Amborella trichopoda TaxID=13333 RepID=W1NHC7_AMBTC|nr:hypothetical protein AMTR_s00011p00061680 [Amborella trichopoda]
MASTASQLDHEEHLMMMFPCRHHQSHSPPQLIEHHPSSPLNLLLPRLHPLLMSSASSSSSPLPSLVGPYPSFGFEFEPEWYAQGALMPQQPHEPSLKSSPL